MLLLVRGGGQITCLLIRVVPIPLKTTFIVQNENKQKEARDVTFLAATSLSKELHDLRIEAF